MHLTLSNLTPSCDDSANIHAHQDVSGREQPDMQ
jgi:hypothetical protein